MPPPWLILNLLKSSKVKWGFLGGSDVQASACNVGDWVRSLGWEDPLEKGMATPPVFLSGEFHEQRSLAGYSHGASESDTERLALQSSCLENPMDGGAW